MSILLDPFTYDLSEQESYQAAQAVSFTFSSFKGLLAYSVPFQKTAAEYIIRFILRCFDFLNMFQKVNPALWGCYIDKHNCREDFLIES